MTKLILSILIFFFGALTGAFFLFLFSKYRIYEILRSEKKKYLEDSDKKLFVFRYFDLIYILKKRKDELKKRSDEYYSEIRLLRQKIEELSSNILIKDEPKSGNKAVPFEVDKSEIPIKSPEPQKECWFFTIPEEDGRFYLSRGYKIYDENKFYKIEYLQNSNEGRLTFISGLRDIKAINKLDTYIRPVCEILLSNDISVSSKVELVESGKVILKNDYWIIDPANKIKIKII